jgi:hypothetical protein
VTRLALRTAKLEMLSLTSATHPEFTPSPPSHFGAPTASITSHADPVLTADTARPNSLSSPIALTPGVVELRTRLREMFPPAASSSTTTLPLLPSPDDASGHPIAKVEYV